MSHAHIDPVIGSQQSAIPLRSMTLWDRTAIILLGAAGFAFSYDALRQIAIAIHARETLSYLFPLFIDGFIAYGVRAIVLLRHQPFLSRLYTWFLFLAATAASLGANALHAITLNRGPQSAQSALHLADSVVGVLSMLAPLALAGSVHLYILMARTVELSVRDGADGGPGPVREGAEDSASGVQAAVPCPLDTGAHSGTAPASSAPSRTVRTPVDLRKTAEHRTQEPPADERGARPSAAADQEDDGQGPADGKPSGSPDGEVPAPSPAGAQAPAPAPVSAHADDDEPSVRDDAEPSQDREAPPSPAAAEAPAPTPVPTPEDDGGPAARDDAEPSQDREADDEWLEDLLPVARAAYQESGRISRDAIKEAVRARQPISNDRLGVLLARLKDETDQRATAPAAASSALW
ncbi:DUF2637 domain-containing protein [Kitasatospora sp. NPDC052868]|uniref:DUF2637 domain-containing protein n=1 Tax=Streptomycetaceae TaxID=2062 RepID=UPI0006AF998C|nr:DUF2637 domain-containing protein [Streptomyces sp. XY593]KOU84198.1 hypothetical protein ADK94_18955 [Streptomyces sp. XY593]